MGIPAYPVLTLPPSIQWRSRKICENLSKDTLMKAHQSGQDPDMALLCYRSTPINSKLPSPAELMNSRRYRTLLPTRTMLKSREGEREELLNLKQNQEYYYNRTAQILPELHTNMKSVCSTSAPVKRLETSNFNRVFGPQCIQSAVRLYWKGVHQKSQIHQTKIRGTQTIKKDNHQAKKIQGLLYIDNG